MILQTDSRLLPEIQKYGCYYMSILFLINKHHGYEWDTKKINEYYTTLKHLGHIRNDDVILHPDQIFKLCGMQVKYTNRHEPADRETQENEIEILKYTSPHGNHFVVGTGGGAFAFDPWGVSRAVRTGQIESKRIFKLL